jgi:hypothetical protein
LRKINCPNSHPRSPKDGPDRGQITASASISAPELGQGLHRKRTASRPDNQFRNGLLYRRMAGRVLSSG